MPRRDAATTAEDSAWAGRVPRAGRRLPPQVRPRGIAIEEVAELFGREWPGWLRRQPGVDHLVDDRRLRHPVVLGDFPGQVPVPAAANLSIEGLQARIPHLKIGTCHILLSEFTRKGEGGVGVEYV